MAGRNSSEAALAWRQRRLARRGKPRGRRPPGQSQTTWAGRSRYRAHAASEPAAAAPPPSAAPAAPRVGGGWACLW